MKTTRCACYPITLELCSCEYVINYEKMNPSITKYKHVCQKQ